MERPKCLGCSQRLCAINYHREGVTHYRTRCDTCIKLRKKIKRPAPKWAATGYKKKATCDQCGFRAKYSAQLLVYHVDGNMNNSAIRNLKTVCQNCVEEIKRSDLPWKPGDLTPDA